jgi:hypothetical protein
MYKLHVYQSRIGPFFIAYSNGRYRVVFENEFLWSYDTVEQAAQHLAGKHRFLVTGGVDTASLGIPANIKRRESCVQVAMNA